MLKMPFIVASESYNFQKM